MRSMLGLWCEWGGEHTGSWDICRMSKYPRSFLKMHHITSSCTHAERKKVMIVAVCLLTFIAEIDE